MPLLDHFLDPFDAEVAWESFHVTWATSIAAQLNHRMPRRFRDLVQISMGRHLTEELAVTGQEPAFLGKPQFVLQAHIPDELSVPVIDTERPRRPLAVVELISPGTKDRPDARAASAAKSSAYLQYGLGLIIVDVVTTRRGNMHNELMELLKHPPTSHMADDVLLYTTAYQPRRENEENVMDVWTVPLAVGQPLPTMPLALRGAMTVPVDLEASHADACDRSGL